MVTIRSLLPEGFPRLAEFVAAVRAAFAETDDVWSVTLLQGSGMTSPETVVVEVSRGAETVYAYAYLNPLDSAQEVAERLRALKKG